jgi:hypothetical protein
MSTVPSVAVGCCLIYQYILKYVHSAQCHCWLLSLGLFRYFIHIFFNYFQMVPVFLINPLHSSFSPNRILSSSYLVWAVKRLVDYL